MRNALWLLCLLLACDDDPASRDGGRAVDAVIEEMDGARPDARPDAQPPDQGRPDRGLDQGAVDARVPDAAADAAVTDVGAPDAEPRDAAVPDAGTVDAGHTGNPLLPRVENQTCRFPPAPAVGPLAVERAYPELRFSRPLWVGTAPGDPEHLYVMEQAGRVLRFRDDPTVDETEVVLDLRVSRAGNEEGLLGLAFHPGYAENRRVFIYYSAASPRRSVISEFRRFADDPGRIDPDSERVLLDVPQPFSNHNGGDLHFGPDGYLYISFGDGGSGGDPHNHGQRPTTILGSVARIDVDSDACGPYGIPPDNPFGPGCAPTEAGLPEVWAWGLRNVWRMAFDPLTGALWAADVGQRQEEEINRLEGGHNYGWNPVEGRQCYRLGCDLAAYTPPIHSYGRREGRSITGGHVYRGPDFPELWGWYLYGDYATGNLWALRETAGEPEVQLLAATALEPTSFGQDRDGRTLIASFATGGLHRFVRRPDAPPAEPPPARLSDTGCFTDLAAMAPAPGVIPYQLNVPFWSDHASKSRWFALPEGGRFTYRPRTAWGMPVGSVVIKHFELPGPDGAPRKIETRFLVHQREGWFGYTYRWDADGQDATLLPGARTAVIDTERGPQTWAFPARTECDACHTDVGGYVLGLITPQLDGPTLKIPGFAPYPQLRALAEAGYVDVPEARPTPFPRLDDAAAPVARRARVALEVNCAMCHQPEGPGNATIDLRADTPLADMALCGVEPGQGQAGLGPEARLLTPSLPGESVLLHRMGVRGEVQMPPLGSTVVDPQSTALVQAWIEQLDACPR